MDETLLKKLRTLLITSEHIGFMEANSGMVDEYKVLELRDSLEELVSEFMTWFADKYDN
jgi:hypothetical protein